jgi:hypothetical protein
VSTGGSRKNPPCAFISDFAEPDRTRASIEAFIANIEACWRCIEILIRLAMSGEVLWALARPPPSNMKTITNLLEIGIPSPM